MKKALISDGEAVNVVPADQLVASFHPVIASEFVDVPDDVVQGSRLVDGAWTAPPPPPALPPAADPVLLASTVAERLVSIGLTEEQIAAIVAP